MDNSKRCKKVGLTAAKWLCIPALLLTAACNGEVISNEMMLRMYPQSFRPGDPPYLERDFEAGADFICDEIKLKHKRDLCSEPEINWR
jgi:hypothetical protein